MRSARKRYHSDSRAPGLRAAHCRYLLASRIQEDGVALEARSRRGNRAPSLRRSDGCERNAQTCSVQRTQGRAADFAPQDATSWGMTGMTFAIASHGDFPSNCCPWNWGHACRAQSCDPSMRKGT